MFNGLIDEINKEQKLKDSALNDIIQVIYNLQAREQQLNQTKKNLENEKSFLEVTIFELTDLKGKFKWKEYTADDQEAFEQKKKELRKSDESICFLEKQQNNIQKKINETSDNIKTASDNIKNIAVKNARLEEERKGFLSKIEVLQIEEFNSVELNSVINQKNNLEQENKRIEKEIQSLNELSIEKEKLIAEQKAMLGMLLKDLVTIQETICALNVQINQLLIENKFATINEVGKILNQTIDVVNLNNKIKNFYVAVESTQKLIQELEQKVNGRLFSLDDYNMILNQLTGLNEEIENLKNQFSKNEGEVQRLENEYLKKVDLIKEYEMVSRRLANLTTFSNLFKANGFVNYVSGIYLRNLADKANIRFHRITKNQLSLIINDKNDFEVIDYLNNGATRSVKTLSGGQSFQASLCLALALAESIQTQNSSQKNFFFIDEGFGTQDSESVDMVYQTLQSLLKENRIVGFISHLTELQERIPQSITILKNDETGSYIS